MDRVDRVIAEIEEICGRDVQQRNIGPLVAHVRGSLGRAAASIAGCVRPSIGIITGFFLRHGEPPNCETDGPPGAAMLACGLHRLGIPCRIATDRPNAPVVAAALRGAELSLDAVPLDIVAMDGADAGPDLALDDVVRRWTGADPAISHVIAIERCGPSRDGCARSAFGEDISEVNAPLERLFAAGAWTTIGIGDLGNEIGMGSLPADLVSASIENGGAIWCTIACDHPVVAGISNWGAAALLAAAALLRPAWAPTLLGSFSPAFARQVLEAAVRDANALSSGGRIRGRPRPFLGVDGMSWEELEQTFRTVHELCRLNLQPAGAAGER